MNKKVNVKVTDVDKIMKWIWKLILSSEWRHVDDCKREKLQCTAELF